MPRIYIETYGCQMNVSDSELVLGLLGPLGYVRTDDPADADVMLVNTCAVRDHAEQRVLGRLGVLKGFKRAGGVLGVVGCMAQRLGPTLLEQVPQVDLVIGPDGYRGLPELIARARQGERGADVRFQQWEHYEDIPPARPSGASAFVTVQRGCDYRCTFCIVPMTRGPERSRKLPDVVREVAELADHGTTEVTLLGQTVNSYDDGLHDFADLLRAVGAVPGIRLRRRLHLQVLASGGHPGPQAQGRRARRRGGGAPGAAHRGGAPRGGAQERRPGRHHARGAGRGEGEARGPAPDAYPRQQG